MWYTMYCQFCLFLQFLDWILEMFWLIFFIFHFILTPGYSWNIAKVGIKHQLFYFIPIHGSQKVRSFLKISITVIETIATSFMIGRKTLFSVVKKYLKSILLHYNNISSIVKQIYVTRPCTFSVDLIHIHKLLLYIIFLYNTFFSCNCLVMSNNYW